MNSLNFNFKTFLSSFKKKWEAIVLIIIATATFGLYINFFLPHFYQSTSQFLVVQKQNPSIDAYTAIKGSEQLAYTLKQVILAPGFLKEVLKSNFDLQSDYAGRDPEKIQKKWQKTVEIETLPNTGILKIKIWHSDSEKAQKINEAVTYLLLEKRSLFLGDNPEITLTNLGEAVTSRNFKKPNAEANVFLGFIVGILISSSLIIFFPERTLSLSKKYHKTVAVNKNYLRKKEEKGILTPDNLPVA